MSREERRAWLSDPVLLIANAFILPTGQTYGEGGQPWQMELFKAVFALRPDGKPENRIVYDERRRGESKTADMAAAAVADLLTGPRMHKSFAVAADEDQGRIILDSVLELQDRSPMLAGLVVQKSTVTNPDTGSVLRVLAADERTNFGLRPRKVFFDELSLQTDRRLWTVMWTGVGKSPYSQMVAVSMAGFDFASIGWDIREKARANPAYYFHTREGSELAPWLSAEDIEEQRATTHPADFARFWECRWTEGDGQWITREMYDAAEVGVEAITGNQAYRYFGYVDIGLSHDLTAIAVCHAEGDRVILDTLVTMQGSKAEKVQLAVVEDRVEALTAQFGVREWTFESWQAEGSVQRLQERLVGVKVNSLAPTSATQRTLFQTTYTLLATVKLTTYPHEQLRREILGLTYTSAGKVIGTSAVHQDCVIALGGAANLVIQAMQKKERNVEGWAGNFGSTNAGLVLSGDRGAPFGFGFTGRPSVGWNGGPDNGTGGTAEVEAARERDDPTERHLQRIRENLGK